MRPRPEPVPRGVSPSLPAAAAAFFLPGPPPAGRPRGFLTGVGASDEAGGDIEAILKAGKIAKMVAFEAKVTGCSDVFSYLINFLECVIMPALTSAAAVSVSLQQLSFTECYNTMAEQLEFDPAMFGMKSNHGMLRADKNPSTGANSQGIQAGGAPPSNFGYNQQQQGNRGRGGGGQRGGFNRGRGGNRGGRGGARGGFNAGQRSNDGQPFKVSYTIAAVVSPSRLRAYILHCYNSAMLHVATTLR